MMNKKIYFDMDGTIADLYGVDGWLDCILNGNARPYIEAKPMVNMQVLARQLNALRANGYEVCVLSWLAKGANDEYNAKVTKAKKGWLARHLASVQFDEIIIVDYGTPKHTLGEGILFDDEEKNREGWGEGAYEPKDIFKILGGLC
jgi:hypothetical protein